MYRDIIKRELGCNWVSPLHAHDIWLIEKDGLYRFWVDYKKSFLNNETYEMAKPFFNSDWTIVKKDGLYNILHKTGTHLLPNWVEYVGEYVWKEECAFVVDNGEEKVVTVNTLLN